MRKLCKTHGDIEIREILDDDISNCELLRKYCIGDKEIQKNFKQNDINKLLKMPQEYEHHKQKPLYIFYTKEPIGQITFEPKPITYISILIAPNHRKKGLGTKALRLAIELIFENFSDVNTIGAKVSPDNEGSRRMFINLRFKERKINDSDNMLNLTRKDFE